MPSQAQHTTLSPRNDTQSMPRWRRIARVAVRRIRRRLNSRYVVLFVVVPALAALAVVAGFYLHFSRIIDQQLRQDPFEASTSIYAAPLVFSVNDPATAEAIQSQLSLVRYRGNPTGPPGTWQNPDGQSIALFP